MYVDGEHASSIIQTPFPERRYRCKAKHALMTHPNLRFLTYLMERLAHYLSHSLALTLMFLSTYALYVCFMIH